VDGEQNFQQLAGPPAMLHTPIVPQQGVVQPFTVAHCQAETHCASPTQS
jgi:hypothetical protein